MRVRTDVVIVGAGVIGLGVAWRAARLGVEVTLIDPNDPGRSASRVAAGMLAPVTEAHFGEEGLLPILLRSAEMYPGFLQDLRIDSGRSVDIVDRGTLYVALDRDQLEALKRLHEFQQSLGLDAIGLGSEDARGLETALSPSTLGAVLAKGDKAIDPRELLAALRSAITNCGGKLETGEVVEVASKLITLSDGTQISCERVVLTSGAWTGSIRGVPLEVAAAIRPVKGQLLHLSPPPGEPGIVSHVIRTEEMYLVPRSDGELICGATVEEKGFDTSVTTGAIFELLRASIEAVPGIREFEITETIAGLRPASLDNAPLIGPTSIEGIIAATGHYRNGILLTPITADAVAGLLAKDELHDEMRPFDPRRFARAT